jgi:two-component system cell cycle sensor histidine kinase/response regulator CckA
VSWLEATETRRAQAARGFGGRENDGAGGRLGWPVLVALVFVGLAVLIAILVPRAAGLGGLVLLAGVGAVGLTEFMRQATRPRGRRVRSATSLARRALHAALDTETLFVTGQGGAQVYATGAYKRLAGRDDRGRALALERLLEEDGTSPAAFYRLAQAARAGERASETLSLLHAGKAARYAVSVAPLGAGPESALWRLQPADASAARDALPAPERESVVPLRGHEGQNVIAASRIVDQAPVGIAVIDSRGTILEANRNVRALIAEQETPVERFGDLLASEDAEEFARRLAATRPDKAERAMEIRLKGKRERAGDLYVTRLDEEQGKDGPASYLLYFVETTEQKNLELQFAQSQKMEAVGQLAGGIAHDFNNVLTAILGFCDLLLTRHQAGDPSFADIMQIHSNAVRAAGLVRQLLAFSRQQALRPKVLWLPDAIAENKTLLVRLVGERVRLDIKHDRDVGLVKVDEVQLAQVLMNLAANARDAMPEGGTLSIRTRNVSRAESAALGHELMPAGDYVLMEVQDTGTGIPPEIIGKIFEPFFTTKEVGQGTGLGLSTVYGIVKQTQGFIFPESEPGKGTTFRIYLPRFFEQAEAQAEEQRPQRAEDHTGRGTVLLVEDEDAVRAFASRALASRGYTVIEAATGEAALEALRDKSVAIDLVISDVIMPAMDGPTLVREVRALEPELKIILISGYAEDAFRKELGRDQTLAFLPKPFSLKQLISKVKEVMSAD